MVHSIGSCKMAAIARVLAQESVSQTITEDVGCNKLAAQYIQRELWEADEANLLDEDDMHVFGLKPTTDPLNLVCCNKCKKPVRDSQFAAHAELCKSLSSVEVIVPKLNHGTKRKNPPRKERKKSSKVPAVQPTLGREMKPLKTIGSHGSAPSSSRLNKQMQLTSSCPDGAKGIAPGADGLLMMDTSEINSGFVDRAEGAEEPPRKHSKLLAADSQLILDQLGTAKGVNKNLFLNTQEAITCEFRNGSKLGSGKTSEHVGYQIPRQVHNSYSPTRGVPAPLATKIYYSQRDQHIRSAITDLYKASTDECWSDLGVLPFSPQARSICHSAIKPGGVAPTKTEFRHSVIDSLQHYLLIYRSQIAQMRSFLDLYQLVAYSGETARNMRSSHNSGKWTRMCLLRASAICLGSCDTKIACE